MGTQRQDFLIPVAVRSGHFLGSGPINVVGVMCTEPNRRTSWMFFFQLCSSLTGCLNVEGIEEALEDLNNKMEKPDTKSPGKVSCSWQNPFGL